MTWISEAHQSIVGSLRLAVMDEGGFDNFNLTVEGFWRSFSAIIILAPLYLYAQDLQATIEVAESTGIDETETTFSLATATFELLLQWIAWPLAMAVIARYAGLVNGYLRYITVYNWSSILVGAVQVLPIFLYVQGGVLADLGSILLMAGLAVVIYYRWYIAYRAFDTSGSVASALVLADLVLSFSIIRLIA